MHRDLTLPVGAHAQTPRISFNKTLSRRLIVFIAIRERHTGALARNTISLRGRDYAA